MPGSRRIYIISILVLGLGAALSAAAGPYFLSDSPLARFSAEDRAVFRGRVEEALNTGENGEEFRWSNPDSSARGVITVLDTVPDPVYGSCKRVRVSNEVRGVRATGVYRACRASNGTWRLHSAGES